MLNIDAKPLVWVLRVIAIIIVAALFAALILRQQVENYFAPGDQLAPRALVVWYRGIGEQEITERLQIAAKNIGLDLRVVTTGPKFYLRALFPETLLNTALQKFKPDFILTIQDWLPYIDGKPNYMALTLGTERYIKDNELINAEHAKFDALLPSFQHIEQLRKAVESNGKTYNGFAWYPTAHATNYKPAMLNKLFYAGGFLWDETRNSAKYHQLFQLLDKTKYFAVSGPKRKWRETPNSAIGFIPVDGQKLLATHRKYGISLLLHTQLHLNGGAPTGRIFEAAAANTVIISDKHPFIQKHFGDNVLYIDVAKDAPEIFAQIDQHMQWIKANPLQAQQMADNCHKIFLQNFTLEQQLQRLLQMHVDLNAQPENTVG